MNSDWNRLTSSGERASGHLDKGQNECMKDKTDEKDQYKE